jgi:hypothetical protein
MYFSLNSKNFLIDTNIFLEILLDRKGAIECQRILNLKYRYFISAFSLYFIIEIIRLNLNDFYDVFSYDKHFDKTKLKRIKPKQLLRMTKY